MALIQIRRTYILVMGLFPQAWFHVASPSRMLFKFAAIFDRWGKTIVILERHSLSKSSFNNREKQKGRFPRTKIRATNCHSNNKG
ncbi:hypothetical protein V1281_002367 [Nitrobacteraceae bacterium AZCC 2161]